MFVKNGSNVFQLVGKVESVAHKAGFIPVRHGPCFHWTEDGTDRFSSVWMSFS